MAMRKRRQPATASQIGSDVDLGDEGRQVSSSAASVAPSASPPAIPSTRTGAAWAGLAVGMVLLVLVLVFILQNLKTVRVSFFTLHWRIPLALDLLLATVAGGVIVFTAGSLRMLQLRRVARRHARRRSTPARTTPRSRDLWLAAPDGRAGRRGLCPRLSVS